MSEALDRAYFDVSVERLKRISPFWTASFRSLTKFPAPRFVGALDGAEQQRLIAAGQAVLQSGKAPEQAGLEPAGIYFYLLCGMTAQREAEMLPHVEALLARYPLDSALHFLRGYANFCSGHLSEAFRDFTRCNALNDKLEHGRVALTYMYGLMRDHLQALRMVQPIGPKLEEIMPWWPVVRHLPLICFQAEFLMTGQSRIGEMDSTLMPAAATEAHRVELAQWLPATVEVCAWEQRPPSAYFASCDPVYFNQYAVPLVLSHLESGGPQAFHVHIVNPDEATLSAARSLAAVCKGRLRVTSETVDVERYGVPSIYYSCIRFCRLSQFMESGQTSYMALDADMLIHRPVPDSLLASGSEACQLTCVPDEPMWNHYAAGFLVISAEGHQGVDFLSRVATFIMHSMKTGKARWFLDQIGLFLSAYRGDCRIGLLDHTAYCDLEHRPDSYIWAVTNDKHAGGFAARRTALLGKYANQLGRTSERSQQASQH